MPSGTFAAFSKIHLNTSKSTFMKVVHLVEGHNFHVDWHFKFLVEIGGKCGRLTVAPVHRDRAAFKVGKTFLQNLLRKTLYGFVKVVEGSEIYNFHIHHFVHFYSRFLRKTRSNRGNPQRSAPECEHARAATSPARRTTLRRAPAAPAPGPAHLGIRALCAPSQHCTPSQHPRPEVPCASRRPVRAALGPAVRRPRLPGAPAEARPSYERH
jgi:hypothetical protein